MNGSPSCDLFSHPDKKLRDHLLAVAEFCSSTHNEANPDFSTLGFSQETLSEYSRLIGLCHDIGKATTFFQTYLFSDDKERIKLKTKPETQHGLISAVFTYHCVREIFAEKLGANGSLLPFIGYVLVRRHHGDLKNFFEETANIRTPEKKEILKRQCDAIPKDLLLMVYRGLLPDTVITRFFGDLDSILASIISDGKIFSLKPQLEKVPEDAAMEIFALYHYSLLLAGDKLDAADLQSERENIDIRPDLIDRYRESSNFLNPSTPMGQLRNEIYDDVISKIEGLDLNQRIFSLNVPTGTGKTLLSASFALKLRERILRETGTRPRIVYCLPFLSIIDQNYDVIKRVFSSEFGDVPPSNILLKHHHLADINYETQDNESYDEDASRLLVEGWHSEFIITTFVQFFHTILSNKNRAIRKYHALANAIIILDEVQSIPHEYWLLFHDILQTMATHLRMHVVFMTATQPLIFSEQNGEIVELATDKKRYFSNLDRVTLHFLKDPLLLTDFIVQVKSRIQQEPRKNFLIVLNTINSAKQVLTSLSQANEPDTEYIFLSTHIVPKVRLERIKKIRENPSKKRIVIVSTQLIEAGVDIDVDIVYRDMAPLDSVNQVAGRCNRNNLQNTRGEVNIVVLKDDKKEFFHYIYSQFLIDKTNIVFEGKTSVHECDFLSLNEHYYRLVKELHADDLSKECLSMIRDLKLSGLQEKFHLIQNDYPKIDVFVECDENAQTIWQRFIEIKSKPFPERRREFIGLRKEFFDYVISVPKNNAQRLFDEERGIGYISQNELHIWYDKETGFSRSEGGTLII